MKLKNKHSKNPFNSIEVGRNIENCNCNTYVYLSHLGIVTAMVIYV